MVRLPPALRGEAMSDTVNPVSNVIFGVIVVWYLYRVITFQPQKAR